MDPIKIETTNSQVKRIVILDDNFVIRYILKTSINRLCKFLNIKFQIYSSDNGVEGLGYIYVTDPDIIIMDLSLPQYSGREVVEYLATNEKFHDESKKIITLQDGKYTTSLPEGYKVLLKESPSFLQSFYYELNKFLQPQMKTINTQPGANDPLYASVQPSDQKNSTQPNSIIDRFVKFISQATIKWANRGDLLMKRTAYGNKILHFPIYIGWFICQLFVSFYLIIIKLIGGNVTDSNVIQLKSDMREFRVKYYPTIAIFISAVLIFNIQLCLYLSGGVALFHKTEIEKTHASITWYNYDWNYRKKITIDHTKVSGTTNLSNFPVLISLTDSDLQSKAQSDGDDILFTSSNGTTKLDHEIESYTSSTGALVAWVNISDLSYTTDTIIYMYYGNSSVGSQQNPNGVWATNTYGAVWHYSETSGTRYDSTNNNNDLTDYNTVTYGTGKIGTAASFNRASKEYFMIDAGNQTNLNFNSDYTVTFWINFTDDNNSIYLIRKVYNSSNYISIQWLNEAPTHLWVRHYNAGNYDTESSSFDNSTTSTGTWYMMSITFKDSTDAIIFCLNNSCDAADTMSYTYPGYATSLTIGSSQPGADDKYMYGLLDEFRITNTTRSNDWIITEYNNQSNPGTFYSVDSETPAPGATVSSTGTQLTDINILSTNKYIGATFSIASNSGSRTVTGITIREQGTVDAQNNLDNIKLYYENDTSSPYDCASESYGGTETQFGSTDTDGFSSANGSSAFTGSVSITTTSTMCVYVVLDVTSGASNGETLEIDIANPSTDVTLASGTVIPDTTVTLSGTTTLRTTTTINSTGTQVTNITIPNTNQYVGGAFVITSDNGIKNVTGITIREQGTVDAQNNLDNIKLYYENDTSSPYDCASESYGGTETQFGSTDTDGFSSANGSSAFTGSVSITTTSTMCVYVVLDVTSGASNGETLEIDIANPSTDVTVSAGVTLPGTAVTLSGTTTLQTSGNVAPTVTNVVLNGGLNITLTENTTTVVQWTATITDTNGNTDINSANGKVYRSGVSGAEACSTNNNNCYQAASCGLSNCSGNSCTATCSVNMQFHADPTDSGTYASEYWRAWVQGVDKSSATGSAFSDAGTPEVNSLIALNVTSSISYGGLTAGSNTGASNQTITITNTGNVAIDAELSGGSLCTDYPTCSGSTISVGYQEYSLSPFTYGNGMDLTASPVRVQLNLSKPTTSPSNSTKTIYWGIGMPTEIGTGTYQGSNTSSAVLD